MLSPWRGLPEVAETVVEAEAVLQLPLTRWMTGTADNQLDQTANAQPALLALGMGVFRYLRKHFSPQIVGAAGHSLGEITALTAAGVFSFVDALRLVRERGEAMQAASEDDGAMTAVIGADEAVVRQAVDRQPADALAISGYNAPKQLVLSGRRTAVAAASDEIRRQAPRARLKPLPVSAAFHSPLMRPAAARLAACLAQTPMHVPAFPVWSNVTLTRHPGDNVDAIREALVRQLTAPVVWTRQVPQMPTQAPALELPPAGTLRALCRRIDAHWPITAVNRPDDAARALAA